MREDTPIPMKPLVPAIPTDDEELRELGEDLRKMGCEGLLGQPWNVQEDNVLREFKFAQGNQTNQWIGTKRRDPENWTPDTWARVYGFQRGVGEGWAGRKDGLFAGKFRGMWIRRKDSTPRTAGIPWRRGVGIPHAHPQSGKAQEDFPNHGQHPIRCPVWSPASELGTAYP
jgi:hypothetical protein